MNNSNTPPVRRKGGPDAAPMRPPNSEPSFGVGNYRSSSRPGQVGRIVSPTPRGGLVRPHQAWKRRAGFVGQGSAAPSNKPAQPATAMVVTPGTYNPPVAIPIDPGATGGGTTVGGQCGTAPPYPCPSGMDPRWWDYNRGCPIDHAASMGCTDGVTMYCDTEQPCGVNVIGANTLGTDGIPPGEVVPLNITAGDATRFRTKAIYFEAQPFRNPDLIDTAVLPPGRSTLPVILVDALVGRISQLRRGGSPDVGLTQGGYSNTKELVPTDWAPFTSTTEHNLALLFFNPNADVTIHVFVDLWGDI